jgi:polysaccharide biosynthesis/export protein
LRVFKAVAGISPLLFCSCAGKDEMKRSVFRSLVTVLCFATVAVTYGQVAGSGSAGGRTAPAPAARANVGDAPGYLIQPNDVLSVFVYKYPELSRDRVLVLPDGRISLPLIQDMRAAGLTSTQLKQKLEEKLMENIDLPNVTVSLDSIQSYQVYVMGKVANPGSIVRATPINVMQALAASGGFREFAEKDAIVIFRGDERIRFKYDDFEKGKDQDKNIWLQSGDVVNVP